MSPNPLAIHFLIGQYRKQKILPVGLGIIFIPIQYHFCFGQDGDAVENPISMQKLRQVIRLYGQGKGTRFINSILGISRNMTKKYL